MPTRPPRDIPVVFISSTSKDLEACRAAVMDETVRAGFHPEWMEHFPATGTPPLKECLKRAAAADLLIVLVGHRYGWIPNEAKGDLKSITWLECEAAPKGQVLAFLVDDKAARADALITFNMKDFGEAPGRFGVELLSLGKAIKRIRQ